MLRTTRAITAAGVSRSRASSAGREVARCSATPIRARKKLITGSAPRCSLLSVYGSSAAIVGSLTSTPISVSICADRRLIRDLRDEGQPCRAGSRTTNAPTAGCSPSSPRSGSSARAASWSATPPAASPSAAARATHHNATAPTTSTAAPSPARPGAAGSTNTTPSSTAAGSPTGVASNRSSPTWSKPQPPPAPRARRRHDAHPDRAQCAARRDDLQHSDVLRRQPDDYQPDSLDDRQPGLGDAEGPRPQRRGHRGDERGGRRQAQGRPDPSQRPKRE